MTTPTREQDDFPVCRVDRRREIRNLEATIAEQAPFVEVGKAMVELTTTVRGVDEWPAIPTLWSMCADERDEARRKVAEQEAEIERLKAVPMKYRRMQFNAALQDENNALRQQLTALQSSSAALSAELDVTKDNLTTAIYANERFHEMNETLRADAVSAGKMLDDAQEIAEQLTSAVELLKTQRDELLAALEYHQAQTRPIQRTIDAIASVKGGA